MPRGLHDYSVRVCLPTGLKVASPLSTDRLIPGLARISEGFKHRGDPVRGAGCIRMVKTCGTCQWWFQPPLGERGGSSQIWEYDNFGKLQPP